MPKPNIRQSVTLADDRTARRHHLNGTAETLSPLLSATRHVLIRGRSGTGKSVLLKYLASKMAVGFLQNRSKVPILLDLRFRPLSNNTVEVLVREELESGNVELPAPVLDFLIKKGGFLLLVDSLNEIPHDRALDVFHSFLNRNANNDVIIAGQIDILKRPDLPVYLLSEVTPRQAKDYLKEAIGTDVWDELPDAARELACNPQDLTLLAEIVRKLGPQNVPTRRAALYREIICQDNAFANWAYADAVEIRAIYALAYRMVGEKKNILGDKQLGEWVHCALEQETGGSSSMNTVTAIVHALHRSRFFVEEEERDNILGLTHPAIGFRHELIGKFLAARHMRQRLIHGSEADRDQLVALSREETWRDAFQFIIDEIESREDLDPLLDHLIQLGNPFSLRVAAYALKNKPTTMVPPGRREAFLNAWIGLDLESTILTL